jgi:hypothetical protein
VPSAPDASALSFRVRATAPARSGKEWASTAAARFDSARSEVIAMNPVLWNRMSPRARRQVRLARELQRTGTYDQLIAALRRLYEAESGQSGERRA